MVQHPRLVTFAAAAAISLLPALLFFIDLFDRVELALYDWRMNVTAPGAAPDESIVVVDISQDSLDHYIRQDALMRWPWPYEYHGLIVQAARAGGARAILFDISFEGGSLRGEEDEELFLKALADPPGVAFACIRKSPGKEPEGLEALERFRTTARIEGPEPGFHESNRFAPFNPRLAELAAAAGDVVIEHDGDGILRTYPTLTRIPGGHLPSLALAGLMILEGTREVKVEGGRRCVIGSKTVEIDSRGRHRLRFYGGARTFRFIPADQVVAAGYAVERGATPPVDLKAMFGGKTVLVGVTAPGLFDFTAAPTAETFPGVEIHATALANMLEGQRVELAGLPSLLATLACAVGGPFLFLRRRPFWIVLNAALAAAVLIGATLLAFAAGIWIHFSAPIFVLIGALCSSLGANYLTEGRARRLVRSIFQRYVSPRIVERLVSNPDLVRLGGDRRTLTCLFMDLEGFTAASETLPPERVVETVNRYLNAATHEIWTTDGTVDKYVADSVVAFWGAPEPQEDHAARACVAAWRVHEALARVAVEDERAGRKPLRARIGINTGEVVVGNVGSEAQFNYTVMGDEVNLASRLEGANKTLGTSVILSERTFREAGDAIVAREIGNVRVLGRQRTLRVYELVGLAGGAPPQVVEAARRRAQAMEAFLKGDWARAEELFEEARLPGDDALTDLSKEWCREMKASQAPDGAGHVIRLETK